MGGRQLRVYDSGDTGTGRPAVVLLTGAGDGATSWAAVCAGASDFFRVLSYDRSGMGDSQPGADRSTDGYLAELRGVLAATVEGPCVLVGHSLGGLIAQHYAARYPQQVAGMVLLDATPEGIASDPAVRSGFTVSSAVASLLRVLSPLGLVRLLLGARMMPLYPEQKIFKRLVPAATYHQWLAEVRHNFAGHAGTELRSVLGVAAEAVQAPSRQDNLPVAVLTSHAYGQKWVQMHHELAQRYPGSTHTVIPDRSHNIHMRHPDLVVAAIGDVLAQGENIRAEHDHGPETTPNPAES